MDKNYPYNYYDEDYYDWIMNLEGHFGSGLPRKRYFYGYDIRFKGPNLNFRNEASISSASRRNPSRFYSHFDPFFVSVNFLLDFCFHL